MTNAKVKALPAPPYDGKPTWHGQWYDGAQWVTVTNQQGLPIIYATQGAAYDAAALAYTVPNPRRYWAHPFGKTRTLSGPFETREQAIAAVFAAHPKAKEATSGYGVYGPFFDIRWDKRDRNKQESEL